MVMVILIFITSITCLFISLLALGIALRFTYFQGDEEIRTYSDEAILISGCDSGIGLALARYFYKTTNYTIICGFLKLQSDGHKELQELGQGRIYSELLDLTSSSDVDKIVVKIKALKETGAIKHLVALINNAGIMAFGEFDWLTWDQIQSQIDVNLIGTLRLTRAIVPYIIHSKGRILNVSSVNDTTVFPGLSVYSATKSALSIFSRGLGYELRKFKAHVVTVRLGDFARLTNIMAGHATRRDNMWNEMDADKRHLYRDSFHNFNDHLMKNYGMTSPSDFNHSSLFQDFRNALLSKNPPTNITCAPLHFKIFYMVMEQIPIWVQYRLLDILIQFGFKYESARLPSANISN